MNGLRFPALVAAHVALTSLAGAQPAPAPPPPVGPAAPPEVPPPPAAAAPTAPAEPAPPATPPGAPPPDAALPASTLGRGKIDLTTPPPAPSVPRSYHMHDGFYARGSIGFGSFGASLDDDDVSGQNLKGSGAGLTLDLMFGGSPTPGVAIGGGLIAEGSSSVELDRRNLSIDRSMSLFMVGPFVDGFFRANRGWHMGGMLGLARHNVGDRSGTPDIEPLTGLGGAFWLGNDFWVSDEWSVGPLLRFSGSLTRDKDSDVNASTFGVSLLFTALYH